MGSPKLSQDGDEAKRGAWDQRVARFADADGDDVAVDTIPCACAKTLNAVADIVLTHTLCGRENAITAE